MPGKQETKTDQPTKTLVKIERAGAQAAGAVARNRHVRVVPFTEDEVLITHGLRSTVTNILFDEKRRGVLSRFVQSFESPATLDQVASRFPAEAREDLGSVFQELCEARVLIHPDTDLVDAFFALHTGADERLAHKTVAVVGAGPLGARVARAFAQMRVGQTLVVDDRPVPPDDVVDVFMPFPRNGGKAQRVSDFVADGIGAAGGGKSRAVAAATHDEAAVESAVKDADLVVLALDRFSPVTLRAANAVSLRLGLPLLVLLVDGTHAMVGPTFVPPRTACYLCFEMHYEAALNTRPLHEAYKKTMAAAESREGVGPVAPPPLLDVVAGLGAFHAASHLLNGTSALEGRANFHDFERLIVDVQEVIRLPRCPACRHRTTEVTPS